MDGGETLTGLRLRLASTSLAPIAPGATVRGRDEEPIGEVAMRTERPAPWGFDVWDPRLSVRQQAADAQHEPAVDELELDDAVGLREPAEDESRELETVGGGPVRSR